MKKFVVVLAGIALAMGVVTGVMAQEKTCASKDMMGQTQSQVTAVTSSAEVAVGEAKAAVENVGNMVCPVMGEPITNPGEYTVEYEGKLYNLCCAACKEQFLKDPAKYVAKAKEEIAAGKDAVDEMMK